MAFKFKGPNRITLKLPPAMFYEKNNRICEPLPVMTKTEFLVCDIEGILGQSSNHLDNETKEELQIISVPWNLNSNGLSQEVDVLWVVAK
jgi:hypothetical protein